MSTRQKRRERLESDILEASTALLAEHGLEGLTVARIAKAIDYTPGALYRYYPSKDAIIAELHRAFVGDLLIAVEQRLADLPSGPREQLALAALVACSEAYITYARVHPTRFRLFAVALADPRTFVGAEHTTTTLAAYMALYATVSGRVQEAVQAGVLRADVEPGQATLAFVLALQGPLQAGKLAARVPGLLDAEALARTVTDTLLVGWGADPGSVVTARSALR
ncbi:MAG: TetR/AcrR family transcriptional regulator [Myxococcales bacterium]|nr:TetR/AcrR family transcriptional regulator [Myxococcales bacterium]